MTSSGRGFSKRRETLSSTSEPSSTGDTPAHTSLLRFDTFIFTHTDNMHTQALLVYVLSCAVVEQRSAVGLGARRGSTPDGRLREEPEPCDRSTRRRIPFRIPAVRLRWDVLQRLPHRLVTASSGCPGNRIKPWQPPSSQVDKQQFWWTNKKLHVLDSFLKI